MIAISGDALNEEFMALNDKDRSWIVDQIVDQIKDSHKPNGWNKAVERLREFGTLATIAGLCVALLAIALGAVYQSFSHVKEETEFRTHTKDTLEGIQASIRSIQASQTPTRILREIVGLDEKVFVKNLPALRRVAEQPAREVAPSAQLLREVAQRLQRIDNNQPEYWPTILQFIQFATAGTFPNAPPPGQPQIVISNNLGLTMKGSFTDKVVLLNGGDLKGDVSFVRCRIILTGNPIRMSGVKFTDCVFDMPVNDTPSPFIKQASAQLLASNFRSFILTAP